MDFSRDRFTFGLQVIISLSFAGMTKRRSQRRHLDTGAIVASDYPGRIFIGGFIIGWMSEELRMIDALFVVLSQRSR